MGVAHDTRGRLSQLGGDGGVCVFPGSDRLGAVTRVHLVFLRMESCICRRSIYMILKLFPNIGTVLAQMRVSKQASEQN